MAQEKKSMIDKFFTYSENAVRNLVPNAPGLRKTIPAPREDKFGKFSEELARNTSSSLTNPFNVKQGTVEKANDKRKNLNAEIKKQMEFKF